MGCASSGDDVNDDRVIDSDILLCAFAAFGILCGLLTLLLIGDMYSQKALKINGFTTLVISMTTSQTLYDVGIIIQDSFPFCRSSNKYKLGTFIVFFFGLVTTELTNVLMLVVGYTIVTLRFFNVSRHVYTIFGGISVSTFIVAVIAIHPSSHYSKLQTTDDDASHQAYFLYEYLRVISIFINLLILCLISIIFYRRGIFYCCTKSVYLRDPSAKNSVDAPLAELVRRLALYPLCQVLTRIPIAWYFFGYTITNKPPNDNIYYRQLIMDGIFTPSAGIGFAIIFLIITPRAYRHALKRCFGIAAKEEFKSNTTYDDEDRDADLREGEGESYDEDEVGSNPSISSSRSSNNNRLSNMSVIGERQSTGAASSKKKIHISKELANANVSQLDEEDLGMLIEKANIENQAKIISSTASSTHASTAASEVEMEMPSPPSSNLSVINPLQTA